LRWTVEALEMSLRAEKTANVAAPNRMIEEETVEILEGLLAPQKRISPKYLYDEHGSELFDAICELPEYYPTRTEARIMNDHLDEIAALVGPGVSVIEFGAGSNDKARRLLRSLDRPVAYVPVEISGEYAAGQARELEREFPALSVKPVIADFTKAFDLPAHATEPRRNLIFFPGSTIGNFERAEAKGLLETMRYEARPNGALLIGVDLVKQTETVLAAYNDSRGVTAAFNLNVLAHLNEGIGGDFRPELFRHEAVYDSVNQRIEMRLIARRSHSAVLAGREIRFKAGEHIVTEYSHKYTIDGFGQLAREAGWSSRSVWTDDERLFSVHFLEPAVA
jgi:L-histidine N-alpha-methyltransferase